MHCTIYKNPFPTFLLPPNHWTSIFCSRDNVSWWNFTNRYVAYITNKIVHKFYVSIYKIENAINSRSLIGQFGQFYSRNRLTTHFFHFSNFTFLLITKEPWLLENYFILENIGILILFRMLHIRFRYIEPFSRNYHLKKKWQKF